MNCYAMLHWGLACYSLLPNIAQNAIRVDRLGGEVWPFAAYWLSTTIQMFA